MKIRILNHTNASQVGHAVVLVKVILASEWSRKITRSECRPLIGQKTNYVIRILHWPLIGSNSDWLQVGEGWIQVDDRNMLGELVLGSSSEKLRKVQSFI